MPWTCWFDCLRFLLPLRSTWQMSVSYDLFKQSANFNLTKRAIWVTASTNFETEATFGWFQPQTWKLPWCVLSNMTPIELDRERLPRNGWSAAQLDVVWIIEPPNSEMCSVTGWKQIGAIFRSWQCYRWLTANFRNAVGPRMHFSAHVPNRVIFNWL